MNENYLPDWITLNSMVEDGVELDTVEEFIYENEPVNVFDEALFREGLQKLIEYLGGY